MKNILLIATALIAIQVHATVYENAEDYKTSRWSVYDNIPSGAHLDNVYLKDRDHNAIQFIGAGTNNGYILGNWEGAAGAWNNTTEHTLKWSMNFDEDYVIYVRVMTKNGPKYIYYTASDKSNGKKNDSYIHIGLGRDSNNGSWQDFNRDLEADLKKYEPNNELIAVNAFLVRGNGLVDDIALSAEIVDLNAEQRLIADQFISIFENGTTKIEYDYAQNIDDGRGITAGRAGFTSGTGDMLIVIEKYTKIKPDNILKKYIPELKHLEKLRYEDGDKEGSASTKNLQGLVEAWKTSSSDSDFRKIQDEVVDELYFNPALEKANKLGLKYPLSLLSLYDTNIQHGENGLDRLIKKTGNNTSPKDGYDEIEWLREFNEHRKVELNKDSTWRDSIVRVTELLDLIDEGNTQLKPFTMTIEEYDDEKHVLPRKVENTWYKPTLSSTWQIQLSGKVNTNRSADIYDIDLFDTSKNTIDLLHNQGKKVICYFSAGSYEDWRSDASAFPTEALGSALDGWEGEKWLDVRNDKLKNIMNQRMDLAKSKGCDGVDPDNVDGYTNDTGFDLTSTDQLNYAKFLANEAHKRGLSIGLKNNLEQIDALVKHYDFAVNEQCNQYKECDMLYPFIEENKPVFNIEYSSSYRNDENKRKELCQKMRQKQISTSILPMFLDDSFRIRCEK